MRSPLEEIGVRTAPGSFASPREAARGPKKRIGLWVAFCATCSVLGVLGGYALVRFNFFGKNLIEEMILLPLSLPGIAVAVALIETYGVLRGSWLIILFGHLLYTLPFMMQSITNTLRSFDFV